MESWDLTGKTALICGASEGMGKATAELMAKRGARIIAVSRTEEKLKKLITGLAGDGHAYIPLDLSNTDDVKNKLLPFLKTNDVHILVNNSSGPPVGPLLETDVESFMNPLRAHLFASHIITQAIVPSMKKANYGRIINIISTSVKVPIPNFGVSNTVRGAMASWSKTMAGELAPFNITVNNVLPGYIRTARFKSVLVTASKAKSISEDQAEEQMVSGIPMKRIGDPEEMAEVICFLASPAASYVTGANIPVDGGRTPSM